MFFRSLPDRLALYKKFLRKPGFHLSRKNASGGSVKKSKIALSKKKHNVIYDNVYYLIEKNMGLNFTGAVAKIFATNALIIRCERPLVVYLAL